jgi:hypothetical protein
VEYLLCLIIFYFKKIGKKMEEINIKIHKNDIDKISENKEEWSLFRIEKVSSESALLTYNEAMCMAKLVSKIAGNNNFLVCVNSNNTEEVLNFEEFKNIEK